MKLNFHKAHIRLWTWLAENPSKYKDNWPEWKYNKGKILTVSNYCFACEASKIISNAFSLVHCEVCPIIWSVDPALSFDCLHEDYGFWLDANLQDRIKIALKIANLPWKGRKVFEITN